VPPIQRPNRGNLLVALIRLLKVLPARPRPRMRPKRGAVKPKRKAAAGAQAAWLTTTKPGRAKLDPGTMPARAPEVRRRARPACEQADARPCCWVQRAPALRPGARDAALDVGPLFT